MERKGKKMVTVELDMDDEIIQKEIKKFGGNAGHIIVPSKHIGKNALIILAGSKEGEFVEKKPKKNK